MTHAIAPVLLETTELASFAPIGTLYSLENDANIQKCFDWYNRHFQQRKLPLSPKHRMNYSLVAKAVSAHKRKYNEIMKATA